MQFAAVFLPDVVAVPGCVLRLDAGGGLDTVRPDDRQRGSAGGFAIEKALAVFTPCTSTRVLSWCFSWMWSRVPAASCAWMRAVASIPCRNMP